MAKQAIYYEEARRLFVHEGLSIPIIYERFSGKVARRTLDKWKADGKWDEKKAEVVKVTEDIDKELIDVAKLAIKNVKEVMSPQNLYAMYKAIAALKMYQGVKVLEEEMSPKERKVLTGKTLEEIEKEHHIL